MSDVLSAAQVYEIEVSLGQKKDAGKARRLSDSHEQLRGDRDALIENGASEHVNWRDVAASRLKELEQLRGERDAARLSLALRTGEADERDNGRVPCEVCWTVSWEPVPEEYGEFAVRDGDGGWMRCGYCWLQAAVRAGGRNEANPSWEARCHFCGGPAYPWLTDDETWAKVEPLLGQHQACFECFAAAWFESGLNTGEPFGVAVRAGGEAADALREANDVIHGGGDPEDLLSSLAVIVGSALEALASLEPDEEKTP